MKNFDTISIKNRMLGRIQDALTNSVEGEDPSSLEQLALVYEDSTIQANFTAISDTMAEDNRYLEYLLKEKKWERAVNYSSLTSMSTLVGYKPPRKKSASGKIYISKDSKITSSPLSILTGTITSNDINSAIYAETVYSTQDNIMFFPTGEYELSEDGHYASISVLQGIKKNLSVRANGNKFEMIEIDNPNVEDASGEISSNYFKVKVGGVLWEKIDNILLAESAYSNVYEVINAPDFSKVYIKFGNGMSGRKLEDGDIISIEYIETLGNSGNIYIKNKVIFSNLNSTIYCSNKTRISGGFDYESISMLKAKAPVEYLSNYTIGSARSYEENILRLESDLAKLKVFGLSENINGINIKKVGVVALSNTKEDMYDDSNFIPNLVKKIGRLKNPTDILVSVPITEIPIYMNVKAAKSSLLTTTEEVKKNIEFNLYSKYNIFRRDFSESIYHSDIISTIHKEPYVDYTYSFIEALSQIKNEDEINVRFEKRASSYFKAEGNFYPFEETDISYLTYNFSFNDVFKDSGLKEKLNESGNYLLRLDLTPQTEDLILHGRTFFYDPTFLEGQIHLFGYQIEDIETDSSGNICIYDIQKYSQIGGIGTQITIDFTVESGITGQAILTDSDDIKKFENMISSKYNNFYHMNNSNIQVCLDKIKYYRLKLAEYTVGVNNYKREKMYNISIINSGGAGEIPSFTFNYLDGTTTLFTYSGNPGDSINQYYFEEEVDLYDDNNLDTGLILSIKSLDNDIDGIILYLKDASYFEMKKKYEISEFLKTWKSRHIKQYNNIEYIVDDTAWNNKVIPEEVTSTRLIERFKKVSGLVQYAQPDTTNKESIEYKFNVLENVEFPVKNILEIPEGTNPVDPLGFSLSVGSKEYFDEVEINFDKETLTGNIKIPLIFLQNLNVTQLKSVLNSNYAVRVRATPISQDLEDLEDFEIIYSDYHSSSKKENLINVEVYNV